MNLALLALRLVIGLAFAGHGAQKLFGVFGGAGVEGTAAGFRRMGLRPARADALLAGSAELGGGLLVALGLATTPAAACLIAVMVTAVAGVHLRRGFWNTHGGFEYNLVLIAALFALCAVGAGTWSLDHVLGVELTGTGWALGALVVGVAAGVSAFAGGRLVARVTAGGHTDHLHAGAG